MFTIPSKVDLTLLQVLLFYSQLLDIFEDLNKLLPKITLFLILLSLPLFY